MVRKSISLAHSISNWSFLCNIEGTSPISKISRMVTHSDCLLKNPQPQPNVICKPAIEALIWTNFTIKLGVILKLNGSFLQGVKQHLRVVSSTYSYPLKEFPLCDELCSYIHSWNPLEYLSFDLIYLLIIHRFFFFISPGVGSGRNKWTKYLLKFFPISYCVFDGKWGYKKWEKLGSNDSYALDLIGCWQLPHGNILLGLVH